MITLSIPLLILLALLVKPIYTSLFGEQITLKTVPVDPRDLFYGDYVYLDYEISHVPLEYISKDLLTLLNEYKLEEEYNFWGSQTVYTSLEKDGEVYAVKNVSLEKPEEGLYLKGKVDNHVLLYENRPTSLYIDYDINRFYLEEGTGKHLEEQATSGQVQVGMKVKNGYGLIQDVTVK